MNTRNRFIQTVIVAALIALCLPALAAAQGTYDPYGRPDYRRNRDDDYRNDDYRNNNSRYGRYDNRQVRDSVRRLENITDRLQEDLDRALDRSRVDGTRREDNINRMAKDFHRAADDLKDRFGDGRNLNRSENEARRVFDLASQMGRVIRRNALYDNRVANDWSQVQQELNIIGDAFGYRVNGYNNNGRYNPRNNNDNDYWWRRLPRP
ncbi:MAG: hypothetical protein QOD00_5 [Blastocatellia bacterium]|jgi:hypothetical protein|nr:hypothetical protein [Blastocatellia bacterium]